MRRAGAVALVLALAGCHGRIGDAGQPDAGQGGATTHTDGGLGASGGAGTGGVAPDGGSGGGVPDGGPDPDAPQPSAGCGNTPVTGFYQGTTMVQGKPRAYWVAAPAGLSAAAPVKLVFVWHGCGGSADGIRKSLTVEDAARAAGDDAVFVYPSIGTSADPAAGEGCFDTDNGQAYFLQVLADVESAYCIDEKKVFSTGYSSGGIVSDILGCFHADVVRAVIPVEGGLPSGQAQCPGKVDAFVIHSPYDEQIGWNTGATQTSHSWTDGRGEVPLGFYYANDGCTAPALDPNDATIGRTDFTCATSGDGVHPYRVTRWLHDYAVPWSTDTPHHWFPPDAPGKIWDFIAATP